MRIFINVILSGITVIGITFAQRQYWVLCIWQPHCLNNQSGASWPDKEGRLPGVCGVEADGQEDRP